MGGKGGEREGGIEGGGRGREREEDGEREEGGDAKFLPRGIYYAYVRR